MDAPALSMRREGAGTREDRHAPTESDDPPLRHRIRPTSEDGDEVGPSAAEGVAGRSAERRGAGYSTSLSSC